VTGVIADYGAVHMIPPGNRLTTPRALITFVFCGFGGALGAWAGTIPQITRATGIDDMSLGLGLTAYTIVYVFAMALGPRLARWTTNRAILLIVLPFVAVLSLALTLATEPAAFFIFLIGFGICLGLTDLFMNAEASAIEADLARPVFASFHANASFGVACLAISGSLIATWTETWVAGLLAAVLLLAAAEMVRRHLPARRPALVTHPLAEPAPIDHLPFILLGLAAGLVIAGETAAIMWSAKLLDEQAASLAAIAGLGAAFFGLCQAAIRFVGDGLRARYGDVPLMLVSLATATAGFATVGMSDGFALSVAGFALVGFGTACVVPCIFALAGRLSANNRAKGIGFISLVAGVPRILAPWVFGWLAETRSTSFAFAICALGMVAALIFMLFIRKLAATGADERKTLGSTRGTA